MYAGIYLAQNYDVPKVDDPQRVFEKFKEYVEEATKSAEDQLKKKDK